MNKLVKTLLVLLSTFGLTNMSSAQDVSLSLGVAGNYGFFAAQGKETNTTQITTEYGGMETSHLAIFGELRVGQVAIGIEYNPTDLDSPEKISIFESCNGDCSSSSSVTNKASVTFTDMMTIYANLKLPAVGPIDGLYLKAGWMSADVETKESLGTGGTYNNTEIDGMIAGIGYSHDLDNGFFVRAEILGSDMDDVTASNTTDSTKTVTISDIWGATASFRVGKTF